MAFRKNVLGKIWDCLKTKVNDENEEWLKEHRPVNWKYFSRKSVKSWAAAYVTGRTYNLSSGILDILDAKAGRKQMVFVTSAFRKFHLIELAKELNVNIDEKWKNWEIERAIEEAVSKPT